MGMPFFAMHDPRNRFQHCAKHVVNLFQSSLLSHQHLAALRLDYGATHSPRKAVLHHVAVQAGGLAPYVDGHGLLQCSQPSARIERKKSAKKLPLRLSTAKLRATQAVPHTPCLQHHNDGHVYPDFLQIVFSSAHPEKMQERQPSSEMDTPM